MKPFLNCVLLSQANQKLFGLPAAPLCLIIPALFSLVLILTATTELQAQPLSIRTLAGNGSPGSTNGFGSNARFHLPHALATDHAGNLYVADTENSTVRKISPDGYASTVAGLAGNYGAADGTGATARFYGPQGIAASGAGQLYVADTANHTIRQVTATGTVTTFAGVPGNSNALDGAGPSAQFYHPEGLASDQAGNLYVADTWNHTIRRITPAGLVSTIAGLAGNSGAADGPATKARFHRPAAIAVDAATNLFVADSFNHIIRKINPSGQVTTIAGLAGVWGSANGTNTQARFFLPLGITATANGDLLVADSGNQTLRKVSLFDTNWVVSTVAGLTGLAGTANGTGDGARFHFPAGLASDPDGFLYVADSANHTLRTTRVVPPTLQFAAWADQLLLSWPVSAEGFRLETSARLDATASWLPVTNLVITVADNFVCTNPVSGPAFFKLGFHGPR